MKTKELIESYKQNREFVINYIDSLLKGEEKITKNEKRQMRGWFFFNIVALIATIVLTFVTTGWFHTLLVVGWVLYIPAILLYFHLFGGVKRVYNLIKYTVI